MPQPRLEFWFEFASTYSYLSAMRISALAANMDVEIAWKPFLLGPIFQSQGWNTSPFNLYENKKRFMVRDVERIAAERGLPFHLPAPFPAHSLKATRIALLAVDEGWIEDFAQSLYLTEFGEGGDISDERVLARILSRAGVMPSRALEFAASPEAKQRLLVRSQEAVAARIFGAPTFITESGELFWGDDRLEQALAWAGGAHEDS